MGDDSTRPGEGGWVPVVGAWDVPAERLDRDLLLGAFSDSHPDEERRRGPQAYLVVQGSATRPLPVHFHTCDQFQCFTDGEGTVGGHRVRGGTVHYSDALTPYGPLRPGGGGMSYLTLRAVHDGGVRYMPESAGELSGLLASGPRPASARRNVAVDLDPPGRTDGWRDLRDDPDGLRVAIVDLPAGAEAPARAVAGSGAYLVVVSGSVDGPDRPTGRGALRWLAAGDRATVTGGPGGCRVALLQFPAAPT